MPIINSVVLVGNLVRDVEVKSFTTGSVLNFTIAQTKRKKQGEQWIDDPQFFDVKYFSKTGEVAKFLLKGKSVAVQGELDQETWEKDGQKRSKLIVKAFELQLLGGQSGGQGQGQQQVYNAPKQAQTVANAFGGQVVNPGTFQDDYQDQIPF